MTHILLHAVEHAFLDSLKLFPFLFVAYFFMELIEHTAADRVSKIISRSGRVGALAGAVLGAVPQCSFSAMASGLYSGRVITLGTLLAVFLSASDEMLPIMISSRVSISTVLIILITKVLIGMVVGFAADFIFRKREKVKIGNICEQEGCRCEEGVLLSALRHSLSVFAFILVVGFGLEAIIGLIGEDVLAGVMSRLPIVSNLISATVGLIPNCASSIIITELYLQGVISAGAMMSGLLTGAGVGTLVLFRTNKNYKENLLIVLTLWGVGAVFGLLLDLVGFGAIL